MTDSTVNPPPSRKTMAEIEVAHRRQATQRRLFWSGVAVNSGAMFAALAMIVQPDVEPVHEAALLVALPLIGFVFVHASYHRPDKDEAG